MGQVILLSSCTKQQFDLIYSIYEIAFPLAEQKSKEFFESLFKNEDYSIFICENQGNIEGFAIFYTPLKYDFILLEYIAVNSTIHSSGVGSKLFQFAVSQLFENNVKPILIEIDSTKENDSKDYIVNNKRANFYRKNNCKIIEDFDYILGLRSEYAPSKMELMIYHPNQKNIEKTKLKKYIEEIYVNVYGRNRDDSNISKMFDNLNEKLVLN